MVQLVGVLNMSPDSFSDGQVYDQETLVLTIEEMISDGVDIIDVGAEATSPGSPAVDVSLELERLAPFFAVLQEGRFVGRVQFSLDTMKAAVAQQGIACGVKMINDVSGGRFDENMFDVVAAADVDYVLMYCKNVSGRADLEASSEVDVVQRVFAYFDKRLCAARAAGIGDEQLILDPGMGAFVSVDPMDSVRLLQALSQLGESFGLPVYVGPSRKGFLGKLSYDMGAIDRVGSTLAVCGYAIEQGVDYVRVHDVRWMKQFVDVMSTLS